MKTMKTMKTTNKLHLLAMRNSFLKHMSDKPSNYEFDISLTTISFYMKRFKKLARPSCRFENTSQAIMEYLKEMGFIVSDDPNIVLNIEEVKETISSLVTQFLAEHATEFGAKRKIVLDALQRFSDDDVVNDEEEGAELDSNAGPHGSSRTKKNEEKFIKHSDFPE